MLPLGSFGGSPCDSIPRMTIRKQLSGAMLAALLGTPLAGARAQSMPADTGSFVMRDFRFADGESLSELRIHYRTLGHQRIRPGGQTRNAVLILHGTGGSGQGFLSRTYAGELFGP